MPQCGVVMDVRIRPSRVTGTADAPPSKSYTHRAILAGGLAASTNIRSALNSADTQASQRAASAYGASITEAADEIAIHGCDGTPQVPPDVIDCANSGTTMRLATGVASLVDGLTILTGDQSLRSRPQGPLLDAIESLGGRAESASGDGTAPLVVKGPIAGGEVSIPGNVSSQYISALLIAGGLTDSGITIELETPLKSAPYVDITIEVLDAFGIRAMTTEAGFRVDGNQQFQSTDYDVPGDFSSISYLAAAGAVAGEPGVSIEGARPGAQGDSKIVSILDEMGAVVEWKRDVGRLRVDRGELTGITVDVGDTPDLLPTIAAVGAVADGTTRIENCEHVRYKETDRVAAMATELQKLGVVVDEQDDVLIVEGGDSNLQGGSVAGYGDHRIIMALAIAALEAEGPVTISGAEHVDVSFPNFFSVMRSLGVGIEGGSLHSRDNG